MANDQQDLFQPDFGWFHFFRTTIRSGTWAKMSLAAKAAYPVIKSYAAAENGASFPSNDTIADQAGLAKASVTKALRELAELGLITATTAPGRKTLYSVKERFEVQHPQTGERGPATFDYVPQTVQKAVAELKEFIAKGTPGQVIQVNFNLNCESVTNQQTALDGSQEIQKILTMLGANTPVDNSLSDERDPPTS